MNTAKGYYGEVNNLYIEYYTERNKKNEATCSRFDVTENTNFHVFLGSDQEIIQVFLIGDFTYESCNLSLGILVHKFSVNDTPILSKCFFSYMTKIVSILLRSKIYRFRFIDLKMPQIDPRVEFMSVWTSHSILRIAKSTKIKSSFE